MQIRVARSRKTTILYGFMFTSLLIQILQAKDVSIEDGNQKHQPHPSTLLSTNTKHIVELGSKEAGSKYRSTNPRDSFQDDINQLDTSFNEDKTKRSAHSTVETLFKRKKGISKNRDKEERPDRPSINESFQILRRVLRELDEDDLKNNKHSTIAGTQDNNYWKGGSSGLDITSSVAPRTSTVEPKVTFDFKVIASRNIHGITIREVADGGNQSKNCPQSPEGEVECCIPTQDEFLPASLVYEHTDESGNTCTCDLCRAPQYMYGSCVCTSTGGEVSCVSSVKGNTYMPFTNKCNKPFQCTSVCPGNMVVIKECETYQDSECGCDEDNGFYQTGVTTCAKIPKCDDHFKLELDSHPGAKYTSYSCVPCSADENCIMATRQPTLQHTHESAMATNATASPSNTRSNTRRGYSSEKEQHPTAMTIEDSTKLPTPQPAPETNEAAEDDTILDNKSNIALLVAVGALSTILVIFVLAVSVGICYIFKRNAGDWRPIICYHRGVLGEGGIVNV